MSNYQNQGKRKFHNFAIGWLRQKTNKEGQQEDYVSAVPVQANVKMNRPGVKIIARMDNGEEVEIENFVMYFNGSKQNEKAPDVQFFFTTQE